MPWVKHVLLDAAVTVVVVLAAAFEMVWAKYVLLGYTPFILGLKVLAFFAFGFAGQFKARNPGTEVPTVVFHVLYGLNTALLLVYGWWGLAALWAAIWMVSIGTELRQRPSLRPQRTEAQA